ncbi:MAG: chromosome segregation protein SMC, partial [Desulfobacterales bacterium]
MKLKKLEISGFKSFPQKSAIHFPAGISAVVGPNGCGKSNIADALRWVMGEQSVKQLRGKSMEDVIFSGTNGTAPTNLAEVSLTLVNDNGSAPVELKDYSEIMLTRRLYRSGESAYLLNRRPCRLKDIQNIFLGSGLGPKSYAIIQQGNVGAIIEAGPEGLRYFLEEAAGITRYKSRKDEALRKVNQTHQNLLRLQDILSEIQRQMQGLKRQAKRAAKYRKYQKKIRGLDTRLALITYDSLSQAGAEDEGRLQRLQDRHQADTAQLRTVEAALETIKAQRWEKNEAMGALRSRQHADQRRADGMEHDLKHTRESVAELKSEIHELQAAQSDLGAKNQGLAQEIAQVETEIQTLEAQTHQAREAIEREEGASRTLRQEADQLQKDLEQKKRTLMEMVAQEARINNIFQSATENRDQLKRRLKQTDENAYLAAKKVEELESQEQTTADELAAANLELEDLNGHCGRLRQELSRQSEALGAQVKAVQNQELEYSKAASQLAALKKMESNYEWYRDGIKTLMQQAAQPRDSGQSDSASIAVKGVVGDILAPAPGYETATETALGEALQYVIVEDQAAAARAMGYLKARKAGRCGFIPLNSLKPMAPGGGASPAPADPGTPRLLDRVEVKSPFESVAACLLGHVALADDLDQALDRHNRNGSYQSVVTPQGDLVSPQGIMLGGSGANGDGILAKKNQLRALAQTCQTLKQQLDAARRALEDMENQVRDLEADLQEALAQREDLRLRRTEIEKEAYRQAE